MSGLFYKELRSLRPFLGLVLFFIVRYYWVFGDGVKAGTLNLATPWSNGCCD